MTHLNLRAAPNLVKTLFGFWVAAPLMIGLFFMTSSTAQTSAPPAQGLTNPTLALNLSRIRDYYPGLQFLDIARMLRPWRAVHEGQSHASALGWEDLKDQGYLDENGWPKEIPDGYDELWTVLNWASVPGDAEYAKGRYVLTYEGTGSIGFRGDAKVVSDAPGEIVFDNEDGKSVTLFVSSTDPSGTGDYIRNISIVAERHLDLHAAGAIFNPDWVRLIQDARQLRFMDWNETNDSRVVSWADRSTPQSANDQSVPIEYMVQLANEVGAEPWFTMPHMADDDYIRNFAIYVRDHLDPTLPVRVEYSNEVWNWGFQQAKWVLAQAETHWGSGNQPPYHTKKAVETALIWNEVFAAEPEDRLIHVLGAQAVNIWRTGMALEAKEWREKEPDQFIAPETIFDELAITHYFGGTAMTDEAVQAELLAVIKDPNVDAMAYLAHKLRDPNYAQSLPDIEIKWREHAALAHQYGLKLTAYEGGQHVHHRGNTKTLSDDDRALFEAFIEDFIRSPQMAALYAESWQIWSEISDGPFMQFGDMTTPSRSGSWGIYESLGATTLRGDVLNGLNGTETPWWGAGPNPSFQQGVTQAGTPNDDTMTGTTEEDYLLAGEGNDTIVATPGDDGVHGGAGFDTVVLSQGSDAYTIRPTGDGYTVSGPQGTDFYIDVEQVIFAGGVPVVLSTLPLAQDGTLVLPDQDALWKGAPNLIQLAEVGELTDAGTFDGIIVDVSSRIEAIKRQSALGQELGLDPSVDPIFAYFVYRPGAQAMIGDQVITPTSQVVHENRLTADGPLLTDSAVTTARLLGSIALNVRAVMGSAEKDRLIGRATAEVIAAGSGDDFLTMRGGDDRLHGQDGEDTLEGGKGSDTLVGGPGNDQLVGGEGADRYLFAAGCGQDTVTDFTSEDILELVGFLPPDWPLGNIASETTQGLVLSNGVDAIVLEGLSMNDMAWMTVERR